MSKNKLWAGALGVALACSIAIAGPEQDRNKENAIGFLSGWGKVPTKELFDRYIADNMVQHSGAMKDGKQAYQDFIGAMDRGMSRGGAGGPPSGAGGPGGAGGPPPGAAPGGPPAGAGGPGAGAPRGGMPVTHRVPVAEKDLVVVLAGMAIDMFRFNKDGKAIEKWGYWQPDSADIDPPSGASGNEDRNRRNGKAFLTGLKTSADASKQAKKYLADNFKRLDGKTNSGRDAFSASLADAISKGARWDVKHTVAEKDMVVFIAANAQPADASVQMPGGGGRAMGGMPGMDPKMAEVMGSMGSPGCGEGPGFASPERGKPGRAAAIAMRFDNAGKITEYWQVEQPFNAWWACAGRWHANSLF